MKSPDYNSYGVQSPFGVKFLTMKRSLASALLPAVILTAALPLLRTDQITESADARYYPLALGNVWTYRVHRMSPKLRDSVVEWRVTHAGDMTYQVWPRPMQSDDMAMELAVTPQGIKEISSDMFIMKFPIRAGERWLGGGSTKPRRSFNVLSANKPCYVDRLEIGDCVTIEDEDTSGTGLKTVTTYGRDVGPVLYMYYRKGEGKERLVQSVTLTGYKFAGR